MGGRRALALRRFLGEAVLAFSVWSPPSQVEGWDSCKVGQSTPSTRLRIVSRDMGPVLEQLSEGADALHVKSGMFALYSGWGVVRQWPLLTMRYLHN